MEEEEANPNPNPTLTLTIYRYDAMEEEEEGQGRAVGFLWQLSRQRGAEAGELEGCFMTEGAALTSSM